MAAAKKSVYIEAAFKGCFNASLDCNYFKKLFEKNGYAIVKNPAGATVILLVMCTGEENAYRLSSRLFERFKRYRKKGIEVIVGGCIKKSEREDFIKMHGYFSFVPGQENLLAEHLDFEEFFTKDKIKDNVDIYEASTSAKKWIVLRELMRYIKKISDILRCPVSNTIGRFLKVTSAYSKKACVIRVARGCRGKCTYCTIRSVRGLLVSRPVGVIVNEVVERIGEGYNHFTIVADDVGYYGVDIGLDFCDLVKALLEIDGSFTISLRALNPKCLIKFIDKFTDIIIPGRITDIESPVESGNNRILDKMNRGYTREEYIDALNRILDKDPGIAFKTHFIMGFADETDKEFNDTLELIKEVPMEKCDITYYTAERGAPSYGFNNCVSKKEMVRRGRKVVMAMAKSFLMRLLKGNRQNRVQAPHKEL